MLTVTMGTVTMETRLLQSVSTLTKHPKHSEMLLSKICPANEWRGHVTREWPIGAYEQLSSVTEQTYWRLN